tara:strand:- start:14 stop:361 length:348 start_codon:yes stop_codon:yes gene_type:complete
MKSFFSYFLVILLIINTSSSKVLASKNEELPNKSQIKITNKYAERFCSSKADHFFEGLDNEKTLKYSYFKYIGLQSDEMLSKDLHKTLINQIKEQCLITNEEEREINALLIEANK